MQPEMRKNRIMLADDHEVVRSGIGNALRHVDGLEIVAEVADGKALRQQLPIFRPDCLLIDVAMPDFDPIPDVKQIRAQFPEMRILVVSAHDDDVYVQGLLGAGVNGYHMKDQPLSDLRLAVERVLSGQRWVTGRLLDKLVKQPTTNRPTFELTQRQQDILQLLGEGYDNQTIARTSGLSIKTVENHLTRIYRQLGVQSRLEAANYLMHHPEIVGDNRPEKRQAEPVQPMMVQPGVGDSISILVVDDNPRYRKSLCKMLGVILTPNLVYDAQNIDEAVELASRRRPSLALIDVVLGAENGIDCTKALMKLEEPPRVVLISAYPDQEFRRSGREAGAAALIDKKDLNVEVLRQIVDDL